MKLTVKDVTIEDIINNGYAPYPDGTILSKREQPLKPGRDKDGRLIVVLTIDGQKLTMKVARIIAMCYLDADLNEGDKVVLYKDRDKTNCHVDNLLITNRSIQNIRANTKRGTLKYRGVTIHPLYGHDNKRFVATIADQYIGLFKGRVGAAEAYNRAAKELYGDLAVLNELGKRGRPSGWIMPQKVKDKISRSKMGIRHTQETKEKISAGLRKYFHNLRQALVIDGMIVNNPSCAEWLKQHRHLLQEEYHECLSPSEIVLAGYEDFLFRDDRNPEYWVLACEAAKEVNMPVADYLAMVEDQF